MIAILSPMSKESKDSSRCAWSLIPFGQPDLLNMSGSGSGIKYRTNIRTDFIFIPFNVQVQFCLSCARLEWQVDGRKGHI